MEEGRIVVRGGARGYFGTDLVLEISVRLDLGELVLPLLVGSRSRSFGAGYAMLSCALPKRLAMIDQRLYSTCMYAYIVTCVCASKVSVYVEMQHAATYGRFVSVSVS